ncbi:MAG: glycosyltransferase [Actinomycetota bacterium]|nr:glycosyltransferase [Actinomycetota bacterium]
MLRAQRHRPYARGKFLFRGQEKIFVKGATYGTFRADERGCDYPKPAVIDADFAAMAENGVNSVRTYTVPPLRLLDAAERHGLMVMVGLPWEQHVTFLDDRRRPNSIEERVREGVRACAGHPAVLAYAVGNEIPASIVRWHGRRPVERFLRRLYRAAKDEDPEGLVTYVNYPSTEYLELPFLDFVTFNVYLEAQRTLEAYLARLQNLAGERPLVMAEIGLDSRRNGEHVQARVLDWQVRTAFAAGCSGAFLFAWTDEWHRGGFDIDDWDFGLTDRERRPKPALHAARAAFSEAPFARDIGWPSVSVVVCTYNGAATLDDCLSGIRALDYPDFEVIVMCDGCDDDSAEIARGYGARVVETPNRGLSSARNSGLAAATGEIVAYCDDDARPDRHWLGYLAHAFLTSDHVGIGGPNIAPPGDAPIADCVANTPGGPIHVLLSDREAEHIPGCNSAFRREALEAIGGWDPIFRTAGDDVDVCWRLRERGWTLGFSPAAVVWHHRRNSIRAFWRQQKAYGRAEALLEAKWPDRYNRAGHLSWAGRMYRRDLTLSLFRRQRVYHGSWGLGLFQSLYRPSPGTVASLPLMPEWHLLVAGLAAASALGILWRPLLMAVPLLVAAMVVVLAQAARSAAHASFPTSGRGRPKRIAFRALTGFLYLMQSFARLWGRIAHGLSPWRMRGKVVHGLAVPRTFVAWSESWRAPDERLRAIEAGLRDAGPLVRRGGDFDRWDLEARAGAMGSARTRLAVEEHGGGKQLLRLRCWPRLSRAGLVAIALLAALSAVAAAAGAAIPSAVLGSVMVALVVRSLLEWSTVTAAVAHAFQPDPAALRSSVRAVTERTTGAPSGGQGRLVMRSRATDEGARET